MKTRDEIKNLLLGDYWNEARMAHEGTSFSPEKRADYFIIEYSKELENDLKELGKKCGNYKEKYISYFTAWLSAKSRCLSWMIAGSSNFPVRRAEKANNSERTHYEKFRNWRSKYFTAVNRVKTPSPEEDLDNKLKELDQLIINNEMTKEINKIISKGHKKNLSNEEIAKNVRCGNFPENVLKWVLEPRLWYGGKIRGLRTLGTDIRKKKEMIEMLKVRIERKSQWQDINFDGGYITIEDDRIKIFNDSKPDQEIINKLKSCGFRWSRHWGCWCRKHTGNAIYAAKKIFCIKLGEKE
jgi:frataxin-like iron-binding protein CyaY